MRTVACLDVELTIEERNLLSVAYSNMRSSRRAACLILRSISQKPETLVDPLAAARLESLSNKVWKELEEICKDLLRLLDAHLIPFTTSDESRAFFHKMRGDYYRCIAEFASGEEKTEAVQRATDAYEAGTAIARAGLVSTNPTRLALGHNFSVFIYEVLGAPHRAIELAQQGFDEALADLENVTDEAFRDGTMIMLMLRDNTSLWGKHLDGPKPSDTQP